MQSFVRAVYLAIVALLASVPVLSAKNPSPRHIVERAYQSPVVFVGEVLEYEKERVEAPWGANNQDKVTFTIAKVKVRDALKGCKRDDIVRVGFVAFPPEEIDELLSPPLQLYRGDVKCYFLQTHFQEKFLVQTIHATPIDTVPESARPQIVMVKRALGFAENPKAALQAANESDRFTAAICLSYHYYPWETRAYDRRELAADLRDLLLAALALGTDKLIANPLLPDWERAVQHYNLPDSGLIDLKAWEKASSSDDRATLRLKLLKEGCQRDVKKPKIMVWVIKE